MLPSRLLDGVGGMGRLGVSCGLFSPRSSAVDFSLSWPAPTISEVAQRQGSNGLLSSATARLVTEAGGSFAAEQTCPSRPSAEGEGENAGRATGRPTPREKGSGRDPLGPSVGSPSTSDLGSDEITR